MAICTCPANVQSASQLCPSCLEAYHADMEEFAIDEANHELQEESAAYRIAWPIIVLLAATSYNDCEW